MDLITMQFILMVMDGDLKTAHGIWVHLKEVKKAQVVKAQVEYLVAQVVVIQKVL